MPSFFFLGDVEESANISVAVKSGSTVLQCLQSIHSWYSTCTPYSADVPFTDVFIEELSALKTDGQTFSVNDFGSTLAAWKMAWSVSRLLLNTNKCVVTGS